MEPLTPDFYHYEWHPLTEVTLAESFVELRWADGLSHSAYALWLAENSAGLGLDPTTRESMIDPADLPEPDALVGAARGESGELVLTWSDATVTTVHPGWLRHVAMGHHEPRAYLTPITPWTSADFSEPPSIDGANVLNDDAALTAFLGLLSSTGLGRLRNTPATEGFLQDLARRIGPIRGTNFGGVFVVRSIIDPDPTENSTANTGLNLGQHADLPTRETPPGFQFLHCVENGVPGGWSRMTDGLSLVETLRQDYPADYEALTTLKWVFANRSLEADHRWIGPMIDHGAPGQPLTLRAFYPVRGFPAMDAKDVPRAYTAMRRFSALAHDPALQIRYPFEPGDMVAFDNRRVLHGRDAFDPGGGSRYLRGCYIDQDDVYSRLRVLSRSMERAQA